MRYINSRFTLHLRYITLQCDNDLSFSCTFPSSRPIAYFPLPCASALTSCDQLFEYYRTALCFWRDPVFLFREMPFLGGRVWLVPSRGIVCIWRTDDD